MCVKQKNEISGLTHTVLLMIKHCKSAISQVAVDQKRAMTKYASAFCPQPMNVEYAELLMKLCGERCGLVDNAD